MMFAFLDEFGHLGPFVARNDSKYNTSPVFGVAGFVMPDSHVRAFATWFFQFKNNLLRAAFEKRKCHAAAWEKKGAAVFTPKHLIRYEHIRQGARRLMHHVNGCSGVLFYYGREKWQLPENCNPSGLHTTVLAHAIRNLNLFCENAGQNFVIIMDKHSSRKVLVETAAKTMFGNDPARRLLEPPFEVESHLYQTVQAADWIAALVGRVWAYRLKDKQFADHQIADQAFGDVLDKLSKHSRVLRRPKVQPTLRLLPPA
jgi:hypothetical protein